MNFGAALQLRQKRCRESNRECFCFGFHCGGLSYTVLPLNAIWKINILDRDCKVPGGNATAVRGSIAVKAGAYITLITTADVGEFIILRNDY